MPNWIEGTMKLRGKRENIKRFFDKGLEPSSWFGEQNNLDSQVKDESGDDYLEYSFKDEPHICGTHRMFITDSYANMFEEDGVCCFDIKQAWGFDAKELEKISEKFNVDIRVYGIEMGMEFCQEILIENGKTVYDKEINYDDWDWECPFPKMGG